MRKQLFLRALLLMPLLPAHAAAVRRPPPVYPLVHQTMKARLDRSDFGPMSRYDVLEVGFWALDSEDGNIDSLRAIRARNPDEVILVYVSATMSCSNWGSDEIYRKSAWAETLTAHADTWLLRDVDGDRYLMNNLESTCVEGRLNYYQTDMAKAYAQWVAEATVLRYGDLIDGIRIDDLQQNVYYMNSWTWLHAPGVDSIDANRDGIADSYLELGAWWSAGADTFFATLRDLIGPEYFLNVNGHIPIEAYPWVNGRYHEGYPYEHGDEWEVAMTDAKKGFLAGDTLYSNTPGRLSGLLTYNASAGYNYDPNKESTKEAPYPHPGFPRFLRFSLASYLLGEGWYTMTGWGTAPNWNGDPIPKQYNTLWWFPVYDTLRTYLGTPVGPARRDTIGNADRFVRDFTGGRSRVFPALDLGVLDLEPRASFDLALPASVAEGETLSIGWHLSDPNGLSEPLQVELWLSRDGGVSFDELLGAFDEADSLFSWPVSGAPDTCLFRLAATDTSGLSGEALSAPVEIAVPLPAAGGVAEVRPAYWIANTPALVCTLHAATWGGNGYDRASLLLPPQTHLLSFAGLDRAGVTVPATATEAGDTVHVVMDEPITGTATLRFRLMVNAPSLPLTDSLRFGVAVAHSSAPGTVVSLPAGDANDDPNDGNSLTADCGYGPPVGLTVEPGAVTLAAGDTLRFQVSGTDQAGNVVEVTPAWSAGDTLGTLDAEGLFRAIRPGSLSVTATVADLESHAVVSIVPGEPDSISVTPESLMVTADDSAWYAARVYDRLGNLVETAAPVWSVAGTLATIDGGGLLTPLRPGTTHVAAAVGSLDGIGLLRIEAGRPFQLGLSPRKTSVAVGDTLLFTAAARDRRGNGCDEPVLWMTGGGIGTVRAPGVFVAAAEGEGWVAASAGAVAESALVQVLASAPVTASIEPRGPAVSADSTISFTFQGITAAGDTLSLSAAWAVLGDIGSIDGSGLFAPESAGTGSVTAASAGLADTTIVTVLPGAPVTLTLFPDSASVRAGDSLLFGAAVADRFGNEIDTTVSWFAGGEIGTITGEGLFRAAGPGTGVVVASLGSLADSSSVTVSDTLPGGPARLIAAAAVATYDASLWPAPLPLSGRYVGTDGEAWHATEPESLFATARFLGDGGNACAPLPSRALFRALPDTFSLPVEGLGGCGLLEVTLEGTGEVPAVPDTILFRSPDASGDLAVDLGDVGLLLQARGGTETGCLDLDGDGSVGDGDLAVVEAAYGWSCGGATTGEPFGGEPPAWYAMGEASGVCGDDSVTARFQLDAGGVDSLRALEVFFPSGGETEREIDWILSTEWTAPRVASLPDTSGGTRLLLTETAGVVVPTGEPLVEIRICGVPTEAFAGDIAHGRFVRVDYAPTKRFDIPIRFLLDNEDTTASEPDTTARSLVLSLYPGRPNPFRGSATIRFDLPAPGGAIRLGVYNIRGEQVVPLATGEQMAGEHRIEWEGRDDRGRSVPPGLYFVRLVAPAGSRTEKIVLLP